MDYSSTRGHSGVEVHTHTANLSSATTTDGDLRYISGNNALYVRHSNSWVQVQQNTATQAQAIAFAVAL